MKWETSLGMLSHLTKKKYSSANYKELYTEKLVEIVSDIYKRDLELFNYGF